MTVHKIQREDPYFESTDSLAQFLAKFLDFFAIANVVHDTNDSPMLLLRPSEFFDGCQRAALNYERSVHPIAIEKLILQKGGHCIFQSRARPSIRIFGMFVGLVNYSHKRSSVLAQPTEIGLVILNVLKEKKGRIRQHEKKRKTPTWPIWMRDNVVAAAFRRYGTGARLAAFVRTVRMTALPLTAVSNQPNSPSTFFFFFLFPNPKLGAMMGGSRRRG